MLDEQDRHLVDGDIVVVASKVVSISEKRYVNLATPTGPIIARHKLGYQLTSAGIEVAVVLADSDGRADRRGATVISLGAAGIAALRITEHTDPAGNTKRQEEALTDMVAAAAGIVLGQRGRGVPVVVVRSVAYQPSDDGVISMLHR